MSWKRPRLIGVGSAILSALFAGVSLYFAIVFRFATGILGSPTFTVDQVLAALTLTVTLVGLIVAVAAIGIGVIAIFGYGELRQLVTRRTDETFRAVIYKMRQKREISSIEAAELLQLIDSQDTRPAESGSEPTESKEMTEAEPYPQKGAGDGKPDNTALGS